MRYQGHVLWDTTLPGMLGYFATMLHNPNQLTIQMSTATTLLELQVGIFVRWSVSEMTASNLESYHSGGSIAIIEAAKDAR